MVGEAEAEAVLIRVNPEFPECEHELSGDAKFIGLCEGAVEAMRGIDDAASAVIK